MTVTTERSRGRMRAVTVAGRSQLIVRIASVAVLLVIAVIVPLRLIAEHESAGWSAVGVIALTGYLALATPMLISVDIAEHRLPNRLVLPAYPLLIAMLLVVGLTTKRIPIEAALACCAYGILFLIAHLLGSMGMGDVKLSMPLGAALGSLGSLRPISTADAGAPWSIGFTAPAFGLVLTFMIGGAVAVALLFGRRARRTDRIPFGPFLLTGFWATMALAPAL